MPRSEPTTVPRFQYRNGVIEIELRAGKNASYEEKAGNYELAQVHRAYARMAKQVRMGLPLQDLFTTPQHHND